MEQRQSFLRGKKKLLWFIIIYLMKYYIYEYIIDVLPKKNIYIYIDEFFFFFWKELDRESHFYM